MFFSHRFVPIFEDVFGPENGGTGTPAKLRKGKKILLWHQVRTTTWLLFIYAKSNFPGISDDLGTFSKIFLCRTSFAFLVNIGLENIFYETWKVNSYSLLICVINFIYLNVLGIRPSRHLLNKDFPGKHDVCMQHFNCNSFHCNIFDCNNLSLFLGTDDKIDSNFSDLTSRFDGIVDHEENCILEALCERHQGTFSMKFFFLLDRWI